MGCTELGVLCAGCDKLCLAGGTSLFLSAGLPVVSTGKREPALGGRQRRRVPSVPLLQLLLTWMCGGGMEGAGVCVWGLIVLPMPYGESPLLPHALLGMDLAANSILLPAQWFKAAAAAVAAPASMHSDRDDVGGVGQRLQPMVGWWGWRARASSNKPDRVQPLLPSP
jgi:hypothetical protein